MRILGFLLMASTLPATCEEEASFNTHRDSRIGKFVTVQRARFDPSEAGPIPMNRVDATEAKDGDADKGKKPIFGLRCVKLPEFWHTIIPSPRVETSYLRIALEPRRSAIFRDLGTLTMQQSPHHGHWKIDSSSTSWSSDCQIYEFFQQSQIALETLDFNF